MVELLFLGACPRLQAYNRAMERGQVSHAGNELRGFFGGQSEGMGVTVLPWVACCHKPLVSLAFSLFWCIVPKSLNI